MDRKIKILLIFYPVFLTTIFLKYNFTDFHIGLCAVKLFSGIDCPGCGILRSIGALITGYPLMSIRLNPMGAVLIFILTYFWLVSLLKFIFYRKDLKISDIATASFINYIAVFFAGGLFLQWGIKLLTQLV